MNRKKTILTMVLALALIFTTFAVPEADLVSLNSMQPIPSTASTDYLYVTEKALGSGSWNNQNGIQLYEGIITGHRVLFKTNGPGGIFTRFNNRKNLKKLTIYANTLIIGESLKFPQTEVVIYANKIIFQDSAGKTGSINTTPEDISIPAALGKDGINGLNGGNITLNVRELVFPAGSTVSRLISQGGNGQTGGAGNQGTAGSNGGNKKNYWTVNTLEKRSLVNDTPQQGIVYHEYYTPVYPNSTSLRRTELGKPIASGNGTDALAPGKPGAPGNGGTITINTPTGASTIYTDTTPGNQGIMARDTDDTPLIYNGGRPGYPVTSIYFFSKVTGFKQVNRGQYQPIIKESKESHTAVPGNDAYAWVTKSEAQNEIKNREAERYNLNQQIISISNKIDENATLKNELYNKYKADFERYYQVKAEYTKLTQQYAYALSRGIKIPAVESKKRELDALEAKITPIHFELAMYNNNILFLTLKKKELESQINTLNTEISKINAATLPFPPQGTAGLYTVNAKPFQWVNPFYIEKSLKYCKDLYLTSHIIQAQNQLKSLQTTIKNYKNHYSWNELSDHWKLEMDTYYHEINGLLFNIASNLDFFGNPDGWTPLLSFEVSKMAFEQEIENSSVILYATRFLKDKFASESEKKSALIDAHNALIDDIAAQKEKYSEVSAKLPGLALKVEDLNTTLTDLNESLTVLKEELAKQAADNLEGEWWQKACRFLGSVLKVVPFVQPVAGTIGQGLDDIADFDPNQPWDSLFDTVGPNLFDTFSSFSKDIKHHDGNITIIKDMFQKYQGDDPTFTFMDLCNDGATLYNKELNSMVSFIRANMESQNNTKVPQSEINAEITRLQNESPEFHDISERIKEFNEEKATLAAELKLVDSAIQDIPVQIQKNYLALYQINAALAGLVSTQDPLFASHIDQIEQDAKKRLLKYHYYFTRAYEYRLVKAYPGNLNVLSLVNKAISKLSPTDSVETFTSVFKAEFLAEMGAITQSIHDEFLNSPQEMTEKVTFLLPQTYLDQLNNRETVSLNLLDLGIFMKNAKNIRILDVKIVEQSSESLNTSPFYAYYDIKTVHSGRSIISHRGNTFYYLHNDANKMTWKSRCDVLGTATITSSSPSAASNSLLSSILAQYSLSDSILLYSRPSGLTDIQISKQDNVSSGEPVIVNKLKIEITYDYVEKNINDGISELLVLSGGKVTPEIEISTPDNHNRKNGLGPFYRYYTPGKTVTLTAPSQLGDWTFSRWQADSGVQYSTPSVTFQIGQGVTRFIPVYVKNSSSPTVNSRTMSYSESFNSFSYPSSIFSRDEIIADREVLY